MADPLLPAAAAAAVTESLGSELFDQNIVHTDLHNISNQPVPLKFATPIQEPPPPYSQPPQSLPQPDVHPQASLSQPATEVPQIPAQAPPQQSSHPIQEPPPPYSQPPQSLPVGQLQQLPHAYVNVQQPVEEPPQPIQQDWPGRLQDPESDPLFKCLLAQDQNTGDCCTISLPKLHLHLNRLYAHETKLLCAPSGLMNRLSNLANSPILQRAFVAGWAMLTTFAFPLIPSHALRCFWVVGQFVFALLSLILSCLIAKYNCNHVWSWVQFSFIVTAFFLAALDTASCLYVAFKKRRQTTAQEGEQQPLIGNEQIQSSRLAKWLWRYNDLLRLIITEGLGYAIVVTSFVSVGEEYRWKNMTSYCPGAHGINHTNIRLTLLTTSSFGFGVFVYMVQFAVIYRMLYIRWWMRPKSSESCKGAYLIIMFLLFYTGHRIIQGLALSTIVVAHNHRHIEKFYEQSVIIIGICTCLFPVLCIITYFIRSHGNIVDFCIMYCTAYLRELEHISNKPGTSQDTRNVIETLLRRYQFEDLQVSSTPYFSRMNLCVNFCLPVISPLVTILSIPSIVVGTFYLYGIFLCMAFHNVIDVDVNGVIALSGVTIGHIGVINAMLVVSVVILIIYIAISPIVMPLYLVHMYRL